MGFTGFLAEAFVLAAGSMAGAAACTVEASAGRREVLLQSIARFSAAMGTEGGVPSSYY